MNKTRNKMKSIYYPKNKTIKNKKSNKKTNINQTINQTINQKSKSTFCENDYNSNDGMLTSVWGPAMWHYLHTMSFNYPIKPTKNDKKHYSEFILNLQYVLPCGKCRKNLTQNFKKLPLKNEDMISRDTFSKYIFNLHELINTMLNKKSHLTYEIVRERYEHFRSRCTKSLNEMKTEMVKQKVKEEKGCVEPLYGEKSKCILRIVPQNENHATFHINNKCIKRNLSSVIHTNIKK